MKKYIHLYPVLILVCFGTTHNNFALTEQKPQKLIRPSRKKKITFSYQNRELTDVINEIATYKKVNVVLPQDKNAIKGKISFSLAKKISIDEAWNILITLLDSAGFILQPKDSERGNMYIIAPKEQIQTYQPPVYINTPMDDLPTEDSRIRYVYYFSNIFLSIPKQKENIQKILVDMLPVQEKDKGSYYLDEKLNVMIISGSTNRIKMIMSILKTFDETGFAEAVEVIALQHVPANFVEILFSGDDKSREKGLIPSQEAEAFMPWQQEKKKPSKSHYFSERTRVVAINRINSLVIFGTQDGIEIVKKFIAAYIDVPLETGKSIVHVYELSFLDALTVQQALETLLGTGKDKQAKGMSESNKMYDFSNVKMFAEEPLQEQTPSDQIANDAKEDKSKTGGYLGGNRLIVACRDREWGVIHKLIGQLDEQQDQVAIDAVIVDLTTDDARALGMQLRNTLFPNLFSHNLNFQSAHLNNMWLNFDSQNNVKSPPGVAANLLSFESQDNIKGTSSSTPTSNGTNGFNGDDDNGNTNTDSKVTLVNGLTPTPGDAGSTVVSFNETRPDGKKAIWSLLQLLNTYKNAHILSRPFVIVSNNGNATLKSERIRLLQGSAAAETSGPVKIDKEDIPAGLTIDISPRIGADNDINLSITIKVNEFVDPNDKTSGERIIRQIQTNAILQDQQLLMLGGLDKITDRKSRAATPLVSRIPLAGWFFKKSARRHEKQTLMVFLVPRIIRPGFGEQTSYISDYTQEKVDLTYQAIHEEYNDKTSRDPIDRNFFAPLSVGFKEEADNYFSKQHWQHPEKTDRKKSTKTPSSGKKLPRKAIEKQLKNLTSGIRNPLNV